MRSLYPGLHEKVPSGPLSRAGRWAEGPGGGGPHSSAKGTLLSDAINPVQGAPPPPPPPSPPPPPPPVTPAVAAMQADDSTLGQTVARRGLAGGDIEMGDLGGTSAGASTSAGPPDFRWIDNPTFTGPTFTGQEVAATAAGGTGPDDAISVSQLSAGSGLGSGPASEHGSTAEAGSAAAVGLAARGYQNIKQFAQKVGYTAVAPFLPLLQRAGVLQGLPQTPLSAPAALGAGTAGFLSGFGVNKASTAIFGANPNFVYGSATGAMVGGILNLGYSRLPGFDAAARAQAGTLGPYSANMARSLTNGAYGFGVGMLVNTIIANKDKIGDAFFPPAGNTTQPGGTPQTGRGLLETAPTGQALTDANGIYDQGMKIWHAWMSDPATKAQINGIMAGPDGPQAVMQMLGSQALSANAQDQAVTELGQLQKTNPKNYANYVSNVSFASNSNDPKTGGIERRYNSDAADFLTANQGLATISSAAGSPRTPRPTRTGRSTISSVRSTPPTRRPSKTTRPRCRPHTTRARCDETTGALEDWRQFVPDDAPLDFAWPTRRDHAGPRCRPAARRGWTRAKIIGPSRRNGRGGRQYQIGPVRRGSFDEITVPGLGNRPRARFGVLGGGRDGVAHQRDRRACHRRVGGALEKCRFTGRSASPTLRRAVRRGRRRPFSRTARSSSDVVDRLSGKRRGSRACSPSTHTLPRPASAATAP